MSGTGNDFVMIDSRKHHLPDEEASAMAITLCRRREGIGADGLILLEKSAAADVRMRYLNADGSEVEMCGNGARCTAYLAHRLGAPDRLTIETGAGVLNAAVNGETVSVEMPETNAQTTPYNIEINGKAIELYAAASGVPHQIMIVDNLDAVDVIKIGRAIRYHPRYAPQGTNADFVQVIDSHTIAIRTYERGIESETLACGTGATASALLTTLEGLTDFPVSVRVELPAVLLVDRKGTKLTLTGAVRSVFTGEVDYHE